jgi:hypothetical protein
VAAQSRTEIADLPGGKMSKAPRVGSPAPGSASFKGLAIKPALE